MNDKEKTKIRQAKFILQGLIRHIERGKNLDPKHLQEFMVACLENLECALTLEVSEEKKKFSRLPAGVVNKFNQFCSGVQK